MECWPQWLFHHIKNHVHPWDPCESCLTLEQRLVSDEKIAIGVVGPFVGYRVLAYLNARGIVTMQVNRKPLTSQGENQLSYPWSMAGSDNQCHVLSMATQSRNGYQAFSTPRQRTSMEKCHKTVTRMGKISTPAGVRVNIHAH
ncbi:hypothetical protein O181_016127 [Austropuccinia psidii MF-1]|uniref:Uncharacterized protein n=1 Tax=Austropuccinia psidii MF-1 TaxID=1389203 RepID=A0A9Q3GRD9_9BASI|nr:hypothetical protein [Austropuccinia psidii MF-1]